MSKSNELAARVHAEAVHRGSRWVRGARGEDGQGTVEYVALLLLLGAVFATVVTVSGKSGLGNALSETIGDQVKGAIEKVTKAGGK